MSLVGIIHVGERCLTHGGFPPLWRESERNERTNTHEILRGALNRSQRTRRPPHADIDWPRTIGANLRHYQPQHRTVVPETLVGHSRHTKTRAELDHVMLCVDQSGSMATSVVYSSILAAVMASIPGLSTKLICFDTSIVDLTDQLAKPVEVLFGVQLSRDGYQLGTRSLRTADRESYEDPPHAHNRSM